MADFDVFSKALTNITSEHKLNNSIREKRTLPTESDFLLMAFMSLFKAYMLRIGKNPNEVNKDSFKEPPVFMVGA